MDFSTIKLFPENLIKALCDTLLHSLWQGLLLAAATGLIVIFTRKSTPAKRYNLLIGAMALFAAGALCTFIVELAKTHVDTAAPQAYTFTTVNTASANATPHAVYKPLFTDNVTSYLNKNSSTIVLIWFLIVCARCLQLTTGLQGIYYLRRRNVFKIDGAWEQRVQELSRRLGIKRLVRIAESGMAKVPMVVGHLKPLILIPVGLVTALSTDEIEAILVHELAHIRRADYLVNLLQSLMEIVFFFNPAVLWVSSLIKTERENCCDDIAVAQSSSKVNYIKALVSCQEYNGSSPAYAMALKGHKTHLKDRVTRIISNSNHSLNRVEKSLLAICLVMAGLLTAAFTNAEKIDKLVASAKKVVTGKNVSPEKKPVTNKKDNQPKEIINGKTDTTKQPKLQIYNPTDFDNGSIMRIHNKSYITYVSKDKGVLYQLNYRNDALISMQVNGKTVPADETAAYEQQIRRILKQYNDDIVNPDKQKGPAGPAATEVANKQDLLKADSLKENRLNRQLSPMQSKLSGRLGQVDANQGKLNKQKAMAISDSVNQVYRAKADKYRKLAAKYKTDTISHPQVAESAKPAKSAVVAQTAQVAKPALWAQTDHPQTFERDEDRSSAMIGDLTNDGIIKTKDNLSFKIGTEEFIVNGKKQPETIFQKYRAKYVATQKHGSWVWYYNFDTDAKRETNSITSKSDK